MKINNILLVDGDLNTSSESEELYLRLGLTAAALGFCSSGSESTSSLPSLISITDFFLAAALLAAIGLAVDSPSSIDSGISLLVVPLFFLAGALLAADSFLAAGSFLATGLFTAFFGDSFFFIGTNSSSVVALKKKTYIYILYIITNIR